LMDFVHEPVLLEEVMAVLALEEGMRVADLTVGGGGHAQVMARTIGRHGHLYAFDRDPEALAAARQTLAAAPCPVTFVHASFSELPAYIPDGSLDAALVDLGVSSPQLDRPERGFSYQHDGPLDMRMDPTASGPTAADVVNGFSEAALADVLFRYGEERMARRIARRIVQERQVDPIVTTARLAEVVRSAIPAARRRTGPHPARRTFQALRIFVNRELDELEQLLTVLPRALRPGGRAAVISFHSLEDRIVKQHFRVRPWQPLLRKPVMASAEECSRNPRARSAKLRAAIVLPQDEEE
jgi:16S rRNA (cytosine1402-N4)-methyltransferase